MAFAIQTKLSINDNVSKNVSHLKEGFEIFENIIKLYKSVKIEFNNGMDKYRLYAVWNNISMRHTQ